VDPKTRTQAASGRVVETGAEGAWRRGSKRERSGKMTVWELSFLQIWWERSW